MKDYYKTLKIDPTAPQEIITKIYQELAQLYHPDTNPPEKKEWAEKNMKDLNEAYEILNNPEKRKAYDLDYNTYSGTTNQTDETERNNNSNERDKLLTEEEKNSSVEKVFSIRVIYAIRGNKVFEDKKVYKNIEERDELLRNDKEVVYYEIEFAYYGAKNLDSSITIWYGNFLLEDSDRYQYNVIKTYYTDNDIGGTIISGSKKVGGIAFVIPPKSKPVKIYYDTGLVWGDGNKEEKVFYCCGIENVNYEVSKAKRGLVKIGELEVGDVFQEIEKDGGEYTIVGINPERDEIYLIDSGGNPQLGKISKLKYVKVNLVDIIPKEQTEEMFKTHTDYWQKFIEPEEKKALAIVKSNDKPALLKDGKEIGKIEKKIDGFSNKIDKFGKEISKSEFSDAITTGFIDGVAGMMDKVADMMDDVADEIDRQIDKGDIK